MVIETERLRLRRLSPDDAEFILRLLNEPSFIQNIGDRGVRTLADARRYILNGPVASYEKFGFGLWAVEVKESGVPAGICGLLKRDALEDADLGYALLPEHWSRGYAFEAASAVMACAGERFGLKRVAAIVSVDNQNSIRLLERLGFRFVKMVRLSDDTAELKLFASDLDGGGMRIPFAGLLALACFMSVHGAAGHPLARNVQTAAGPGAAAQEVNPRGGSAAPAADQPAPRTDQNSLIAHHDLLAKARKGGIDVYFVGDSITRRWGTSDEQYKDFLANWRQNFFGWNAANFGWGGDTTQNILWRLSNGELDNVNPKVIVLMAGTNNVGKGSPHGDEDPRVADITKGIKAILNLCRRKAPKATIVLMGITPRNDNMAVMSIINRVNSNIARFADGKKIRYVNINDRLTDKEGKFLEGMANRDGLHLDVGGYQVWADALKPILTQLLGPPAKKDHAPPPTGDPSARKRPA